MKSRDNSINKERKREKKENIKSTQKYKRHILRPDNNLDGSAVWIAYHFTSSSRMLYAQYLGAKYIISERDLAIIIEKLIFTVTREYKDGFAAQYLACYESQVG